MTSARSTPPQRVRPIPSRLTAKHRLLWLGIKRELLLREIDMRYAEITKIDKELKR